MTTTRFVRGRCAVAVSCVLLAATVCSSDDDGETAATTPTATGETGRREAGRHGGARHHRRRSGEKLVLRARSRRDPTGWIRSRRTTADISAADDVRTPHQDLAGRSGHHQRPRRHVGSPTDGLTIDFTLKKGIQFHEAAMAR